MAFCRDRVPELITEMDRRNQSLVTIHSHPEGEAWFSPIDDKNDRMLLASVSGCSMTRGPTEPQ